jgi:hypothetical protein
MVPETAMPSFSGRLGHGVGAVVKVKQVMPRDRKDIGLKCCLSRTFLLLSFLFCCFQGNR